METSLFNAGSFLILQILQFLLLTRAFPVREHRQKFRISFFLLYLIWRAIALALDNTVIGLPPLVLQVLYWLVIFPCCSKVEKVPYLMTVTILLLLNTALLLWMEAYYYILDPSVAQLICLNLTAVALWLRFTWVVIHRMDSFQFQSSLTGFFLLLIPFILITFIYSALIFEEDQNLVLKSESALWGVISGVFLLSALLLTSCWLYFRYWQKKAKKVQDEWMAELNELELQQQKQVSAISKLRHDQINLTGSLQYLIDSPCETEEAIQFIDKILEREKGIRRD